MHVIETTAEFFAYKTIIPRRWQARLHIYVKPLKSRRAFLLLNTKEKTNAFKILDINFYDKVLNILKT